MNWLEGFLYGLISGVTEFLPVSSQAHQRILLQIFGVTRDSVSDLIVHLSALLALYIGCRGLLFRMRREQKALTRSKYRAHSTDVRNAYDLRLVRTAIVPLLLLMLILVFTRTWADNNLLIAIFSLLGGIVIFISERFPHANKDSRYMSVLDAIIFGFAAALCVFPGISRVGTSMSYATMRGVDKQHSLNWVLILSIPALMILSVFDIVGIVTASAMVVNLSVIIGYITAGLGAFSGAYLSIFFIRTVLMRSNTTVFAYYSWGISMFIFVLHLIS